MSKQKAKREVFTVLKGFCYESSDGKAVYISKFLKDSGGYVFDEAGQKKANKLSLPKEAIELGKKLKAIK